MMNDMQLMDRLIGDIARRLFFDPWIIQELFNDLYKRKMIRDNRPGARVLKLPVEYQS